MTLLRLDHIAMACTDLAHAKTMLEETFGVEMSPRGQHPHMGTHNHLLSLGPDIYFELIAIDPDAPGPDHPRWFNIDNFEGPARLTNWIVATDDMRAALDSLPEGMGTPLALERGDFRWQMAVPESGLLPYEGWAPAVIEWSGAAHPAPRLKDHDIRLSQLTIHHPDAARMAEAFAPHLPRDTVLFIASETAFMEAVFTTPKGSVHLT